MGAPKGHPNYAKPDNLGGRPPLCDLDELADELLKWSEDENNLYVKYFAAKKGIHQARLSEWVEKSERFSEAMAIAKDRQECKLVMGGLKNKLNPTITKLILSSNHGIKEDKSPTNVYVNTSTADVVTKIMDGTDGSSRDLSINEA